MPYTTLVFQLYLLFSAATFCLYMAYGVDKKTPANTRAGEIGGVALTALLFPVSLPLFFIEGYNK